MDQPRRTILITGANGYLGGVMANYFAAQGFAVRLGMRRPVGINAVAYDLDCPIPPDLFDGVHVLLHAAYDFSVRKPADFQRVNVEGSNRLLLAAAEAGVEKRIYISSISAFAGCRSHYGRAKLAVEKSAPEGTLIVRPGLIYGHGEGGMFGDLRKSIEKGGRIPQLAWHPCSQYLVHSDDLCAAIERYINDDWPNALRQITLADSRAWPLKELLREMARASGHDVRFLPVPWPLVWLGLRTAEAMGLKLRFRSDSIISTVFQNPAPDFSGIKLAAIKIRPFAQARSKD